MIRPRSTVILTAGLVAGLMSGVVIFFPEQAPGITKAVSVAAAVFAPEQSARQVDDGANATVGQPAPDFTLKTLNGHVVTLSELRGQPVLINFWASWCGPCRSEMPELVRTYETYQTDGFVILAVNLTFQDALPDVRAFVQEFNLSFPVLLDEAGEVTDSLYRLRGLPTSIFVDREGVIRRVYLGAMTGKQIDEFVREIVK